MRQNLMTCSPPRSGRRLSERAGAEEVRTAAALWAARVVANVRVMPVVASLSVAASVRPVQTALQVARSPTR